MDYIEEQPTGVYIRIDSDYNIIEINSDRFITDKTGWVKLDEGFGDKYTHAQGNYLNKPLMDEYGNYNFKYINNKVVEVDNTANINIYHRRQELQSQLGELYAWFDEYDNQIKQYERDIRLGTTGLYYHIGETLYSIEELDSMAREKAAEITRLRNIIKEL